jgi:hypothetical protein
VLALFGLAPAPASAQGLECPEVDFSTEVGSREITIRWGDPPLEVRTRVDLSLRKIANFIVGPDSMVADDSIAWRGTALPAIGGQYLGRCDVGYKFTSQRSVPRFTTVDSARVAAGWSGTSLPASGGTYRSCQPESAFVFTVDQGGTIAPSGGTASRITWTQAGGGRSGAIDVPSSYAPGAQLAVFGGMTVGFSAGTLVAGESFTIAPRVPPAAIIRWARIESGFGNPVDSTITLCRPDTAYAIENGLTLSLAPGSVFEADFDGDSLGVFRASAQTYDGFRLWRTDISNLGADTMTVLREFYLCRESDEDFFEGEERVYRDLEVHNGFPYEYAVTCFDTLSATESPVRRTAKLYPRTPPGGGLGDIRVVPNPYKRRAAWEEGGESKIQFINVPEGTAIRIYTVAGSLVREIFPEEIALGCSGDVLPGCVNWNLRNGQGREVVSGIYIFHAETRGGDSHVGKFMIAR